MARRIEVVRSGLVDGDIAVGEEADSLPRISNLSDTGWWAVWVCGTKAFG